MMYLQSVTSRFCPSMRLVGCAALGLTLLGPSPKAQARSAPVPAPAKAAPAAPSKEAIGQAALKTFQTRHKAVTDLVAKKAKDAALFEQVDALLDYKALAQAALGAGASGYQGVCKTKCAAFESALTKLIRSNYLRFIRKAKNGQVQYTGVQVGKKGNAVKIATKVSPGKGKSRTKEVQVSYVLKKNGSDWRVVDIITEGVSLRKTYRYEFQKIMEQPGKQGGIEAVIAKIDRKLAELRKKP